MTSAQKNLQQRSWPRNVRQPIFPFVDSEEKFFRWVNALGPNISMFSLIFFEGLDDITDRALPHRKLQCMTAKLFF